MIISRYADLLKIIDNREYKQINITKEFYRWLKHNIGLDDDGNFYGIKLNIIEEKKNKKKKTSDKKLKEILFDLFDDFEEYQDIRDSLLNFDLTNEEIDYILYEKYEDWLCEYENK